MSAHLNAHVVGTHHFRPGLFCVRVALDGPEPVPHYLAGQYATLGLPLPEGAHDPYAEGERRRPAKGTGLLRRSYSVASAPGQKHYVEFYIVEVDNGRLSPQMAHLKPGDRMYMAERFQGRLTLEDAPVTPDQDMVCLATGTGLAPFLSFLREHAGRGRFRRCAVLHSVREEADLGYQEELQAIAAANPDSVHYIPTLTRGSDDWHGRRGRVQGALDDGTLTRLGYTLDPARTHVFLCGAPQMIDETDHILQARGFTHWKPKIGGNLHLERFW